MIEVEGDNHMPDSVFVEDTAVIIPATKKGEKNTAVVTVLGARSRRGEEVAVVSLRGYGAEGEC